MKMNILKFGMLGVALVGKLSVVAQLGVVNPPPTAGLVPPPVQSSSSVHSGTFVHNNAALHGGIPTVVPPATGGFGALPPAQPQPMLVGRLSAAYVAEFNQHFKAKEMVLTLPQSDIRLESDAKLDAWVQASLYGKRAVVSCPKTSAPVSASTEATIKALVDFQVNSVALLEGKLNSSVNATLDAKAKTEAAARKKLQAAQKEKERVEKLAAKAREEALAGKSWKLSSDTATESRFRFTPGKHYKALVWAAASSHNETEVASKK